MKKGWLFAVYPFLSDFYLRVNCIDPEFDEDPNQHQPTAEHLDWLHPHHRVCEPLTT